MVRKHRKFGFAKIHLSGNVLVPYLSLFYDVCFSVSPENMTQPKNMTPAGFFAQKNDAKSTKYDAKEQQYDTKLVGAPRLTLWLTIRNSLRSDHIAETFAYTSGCRELTVCKKPFSVVISFDCCNRIVFPTSNLFTATDCKDMQTAGLTGQKLYPLHYHRWFCLHTQRSDIILVFWTKVLDVVVSKTDP